MARLASPAPSGARLAAAREERGWSLGRLAEVSGVERTTIHKIEKGHEPGVRKAISLARAVGKTVEEIWE